MADKQTPNAVESFLDGKQFQETILFSKYAPVRALGTVTTVGYAEIVGVIERVDAMVGTREDEEELPLRLRLVSRLAEKTEAIEPPALRESVEGAAILALTGYGLVRAVAEDIQDMVTGNNINNEAGQ